jgi:hypothetical protein
VHLTFITLAFRLFCHVSCFMLLKYRQLCIGISKQRCPLSLHIRALSIGGQKAHLWTPFWILEKLFIQRHSLSAFRTSSSGFLSFPSSILDIQSNFHGYPCPKSYPNESICPSLVQFPWYDYLRHICVAILCVAATY